MCVCLGYISTREAGVNHGSEGVAKKSLLNLSLSALFFFFCSLQLLARSLFNAPALLAAALWISDMT
jgi:hypothetical protein